MDRQLDLVRYLDHLGARCGRQPGQRIHCREQDAHRGLALIRSRTRSPSRSCRTATSRLKDVRVPEENRLQGGNSFRDTAKVLKMTRYAVGWMSTGCAMGAYETALKYCQERLQFGRPIGSFQLDPGSSREDDRKHYRVTMSDRAPGAIACGRKAKRRTCGFGESFSTSKCRETVAWARELFGGNGIVADYKVARFFNDCEALYSYEGTFQMQNLIVGKAVTGFSAFV